MYGTARAPRCRPSAATICSCGNTAAQSSRIQSGAPVRQRRGRRILASRSACSTPDAPVGTIEKPNRECVATSKTAERAGRPMLLSGIRHSTFTGVESISAICPGYITVTGRGPLFGRAAAERRVVALPRARPRRS